MQCAICLLGLIFFRGKGKERVKRERGRRTHVLGLEGVDTRIHVVICCIIDRAAEEIL
jgi:hypothetical protein